MYHYRFGMLFSRTVQQSLTMACAKYESVNEGLPMLVRQTLVCCTLAHPNELCLYLDSPTEQVVMSFARYVCWWDSQISKGTFALKRNQFRTSNAQYHPVTERKPGRNMLSTKRQNGLQQHIGNTNLDGRSVVGVCHRYFSARPSGLQPLQDYCGLEVAGG